MCLLYSPVRWSLGSSRVASGLGVANWRALMIIWSVYLYVFCRLRTAIFVPRGKRSDWIFINVFFFFFFLLIYRKRKFCAEPMRERLTFHFGLGTRSVNFRFFFLFFFSFFLFFSNQGKISSCNTVEPSLVLLLCKFAAYIYYLINRFIAVWFGLVLWHINRCWLFNAKSIFIHINSFIQNNSAKYQYCFLFTRC